ncbi:tRNA (guanosine(46)-N7)-methyltransferase TrmB [Salipaludibacillus sp. LMS25]|jgi:tRNA (guanine-N7-)-methyltransferase|uniref:tRNA (guanosine(46)-N7)-methyltransferase TrmB n=1 Tax=Salipaludibacillus sp. LMS25 TaxID=2924031 RepID=UPI0020D11D95|nr:tRNA (guanosine(46)-N7)-methyltransferase TrmB [Salipaludibacillus sp. LMS25]UTR15649.1 tRNA (guanosine(46)-N7)-methyltransferase TrmB [Salipaludibacillus sp. LMS25]
MRLRNKPWAGEYIESHPAVVEQHPEKWGGRWSQRFANKAPLHVEVGTGKGRFLTEMAKAHPNINYIGVEKYESVLVTAVQRAVEEEIPNVLFLQKDVSDLTDFFNHEELDRLYINFTDPWPKKKHAKRRLTHEYFLSKYKMLLHDEGEVHFKTDNQGLFEYSIESMSKFGMTLDNVSLDLHNSDVEGNIMTEYEERFSNKGMRIFRLEARFKQGTS